MPMTQAEVTWVQEAATAAQEATAAWDSIVTLAFYIIKIFAKLGEHSIAFLKI
jgi:hypothetical protein